MEHKMLPSPSPFSSKSHTFSSVSSSRDESLVSPSIEYSSSFINSSSESESFSELLNNSISLPQPPPGFEWATDLIGSQLILLPIHDQKYMNQSKWIFLDRKPNKNHLKQPNLQSNKDDANISNNLSFFSASPVVQEKRFLISPTHFPVPNDLKTSNESHSGIMRSKSLLGPVVQKTNENPMDDVIIPKSKSMTILPDSHISTSNNTHSLNNTLVLNGTQLKKPETDRIPVSPAKGNNNDKIGNLKKNDSISQLGNLINQDYFPNVSIISPLNDSLVPENKEEQKSHQNGVKHPHFQNQRIISSTPLHAFSPTQSHPIEQSFVSNSPQMFNEPHRQSIKKNEMKIQALENQIKFLENKIVPLNLDETLPQLDPLILKALEISFSHGGIDDSAGSCTQTNMTFPNQSHTIPLSLPDQTISQSKTPETVQKIPNQIETVDNNSPSSSESGILPKIVENVDVTDVHQPEKVKNQSVSNPISPLISLKHDYGPLITLSEYVSKIYANVSTLKETYLKQLAQLSSQYETYEQNRTCKHRCKALIAQIKQIAESELTYELAQDISLQSIDSTPPSSIHSSPSLIPLGAQNYVLNRSIPNNKLLALIHELELEIEDSPRKQNSLISLSSNNSAHRLYGSVDPCSENCKRLELEQRILMDHYTSLSMMIGKNLDSLTNVIAFCSKTVSIALKYFGEWKSHVIQGLSKDMSSTKGALHQCHQMIDSLSLAYQKSLSQNSKSVEKKLSQKLLPPNLKKLPASVTVDIKKKISIEFKKITDDSDISQLVAKLVRLLNAIQIKFTKLEEKHNIFFSHFESTLEDTKTDYLSKIPRGMTYSNATHCGNKLPLFDLNRNSEKMIENGTSEGKSSKS